MDASLVRKVFNEFSHHKTISIQAAEDSLPPPRILPAVVPVARVRAELRVNAHDLFDWMIAFQVGHPVVRENRADAPYRPITLGFHLLRQRLCGRRSPPLAAAPDNRTRRFLFHAMFAMPSHGSAASGRAASSASRRVSSGVSPLLIFTAKYGLAPALIITRPFSLADMREPISIFSFR